MSRIYRPTAPGAAAPPEREHSARDERSSKGYATVEDQAVVVVRDATYARPGYRSFEFADLEVRSGEVALVLSLDHAPARDLALAVAGLVRPTSGSIAVCGRELASRPGRRARPGVADVVGTGVFSGVSDVAAGLSVGGAVAAEASLSRERGVADVLEHLAALGLATYVDQDVLHLPPAARARLSAALALARAPQVAVLDLADPFCAGLAADEAEAVLADLSRFARDRAVAVVAASTEPALEERADVVCALGVDAAEAVSPRAATPRAASGSVDSKGVDLS